MDQFPSVSRLPLQFRKRVAIIEGARAIFLRDGFGGSSMDDVARAAGVGKQTIYRHFGAKEALFESLLGEMCTDLVQLGASDGGDLPTALRRIGRDYVKSMTAPANLALFRIVVAEAARFPALAQRFHAAAVAQATAHVAALLLGERAISQVRAEELAATFLEMVKGPAFLRLLLDVPAAGWNESFERQIGEAVAYVGGQLPARDTMPRHAP